MANRKSFFRFLIDNFAQENPRKSQDIEEIFHETFQVTNSETSWFTAIKSLAPAAEFAAGPPAFPPAPDEFSLPKLDKILGIYY